MICSPIFIDWRWHAHALNFLIVSAWKGKVAKRWLADCSDETVDVRLGAVGIPTHWSGTEAEQQSRECSCRLVS